MRDGEKQKSTGEIDKKVFGKKKKSRKKRNDTIPSWRGSGGERREGGKKKRKGKENAPGYWAEKEWVRHSRN